MLVTELKQNGMIAVKSRYSTDYIRRLKALPGAQFDTVAKKWEFPVEHVALYEQQFKGEIVWKTPRWRVFNEPMPNYDALYALPDDITCPTAKLTPYSHQTYGVRFMIDRLTRYGFVINADDVGIGKSLQAILTMKHFADDNKADRILLICKKSIKHQWHREIDKFSNLSDTHPITIIDGTQKQRAALYQKIATQPQSITVINYHLVLHDVQALADMGYNMVVMDEVHTCKLRNGKLNKAVSTACKSADYITFLTGTPIMSRPDDIFGVIQMADPLYFGKWTDFKKKHIREEYNNGFTSVVGYKALDELRDKVQNILIRRTEHEVSISMPSTVYKRVDCKFDNTQRKVAQAINEKRSGILDELTALRLNTTITPEMNEQIMKHEAQLKGLIAADQACANDPRLFHMSRSYVMRNEFGALVPKSYGLSNKTEALIELVEEIIDAGEKAIIFSNFETAAFMIAQELQKRLSQRILLYSGSVSDDEREKNVLDFTTQDDCPVLIGTNALAEGVNLQQARHVIHYDQADTPAIKVQRNGRSRRASSQYKTVYTYDLITEDSKDEQRLETLDRAMGVVDGIVSVDSAQSQVLRDISSASA